jgi:hypothetical protein
MCFIAVDLASVFGKLRGSELPTKGKVLRFFDGVCYNECATQKPIKNAFQSYGSSKRRMDTGA